MKYLRYYIRNFIFINHVLWLVIKFKILIVLLSDRKLVKLVSNMNSQQKGRYVDFSKMNYKQSFAQVEKIIVKFPLKVNCLVNSLVKASICKDYPCEIHLGLKKIDNILYAHAWIEDDNKKLYRRVF